VVPHLWPVLETAMRRDQEGLSSALAEAIMGLDRCHEQALGELRSRFGREASQCRRLAVLNDALDVGERKQAAGEIGELGDRRGREALERVRDREDTPEDLREACRQALHQLNSGA